MHRPDDVRHEVNRAVVDDGVDRVEPERIHVEVLHPGPGRLHHVRADRPGVGSVVVHAVAPGRAMARGGVGPELAEVVPLGTEVVVDHVEAHAQPERVRPIHEALQRRRPAVRRVHRVQQHPVVAPVARAGEGLHRHQLHAADPQVGELGQPLGSRIEGARLGEGPDVQLVEDERLGTDPGPAPVGPPELVGVEDGRGPVHVAHLCPRRGVRPEPAIGEDQRVGRPRRKPGQVHRPPAPRRRGASPTCRSPTRTSRWSARGAHTASRSPSPCLDTPWRMAASPSHVRRCGWRGKSSADRRPADGGQLSTSPPGRRCTPSPPMLSVRTPALVAAVLLPLGAAWAAAAPAARGAHLARGEQPEREVGDRALPPLPLALGRPGRTPCFRDGSTPWPSRPRTGQPGWWW